MTTIEGNIVNNGLKRCRIEIDTTTGLITKVGEPTGLADVVLKDEIIFPGFIDLHVHAREDESHKDDYKEDFVSAGLAAINGGVVAFAEMPNNKIPPINDISYENKNNLTKKSPVVVLLYAGIGENTKPLIKIIPYKVFMCKSVGDLFFTSREALESTLERYKGQSVSFHCEDPEILEESTGEKTHEMKRPKEAEISAIDFALYLIEKYNLSGKICHASTIEGIKKIIEAKKRGINVSVEVTPHHLYFDETMLNEENKIKFQVNPPIRQSKENRLAMIKFLKDGNIDYLATDHAPHSVEEKQKGISGLTHLDTYGPFTTWLYKEHNFTLEEIKKVCSSNPANFFNKFLEERPARPNELGHSGRYGEIAEGYIGSLTILDMNKEIKITKDILKTKSKWSPFEGITFPGRVIMTIIKGKIYEN
jgi:dihydroorotase